MILARLLCCAWLAQGTGSVVPFGVYSNMKFTEEHAYGFNVLVWKHGNSLAGLLESQEGLAGDAPVGLMEDVSHEPLTGKLSFKAKLSKGQVSSGGGQWVPSRDLVEFTGVLSAARLAGTITWRDGHRNNQIYSTEKVTLNRSKDMRGLQTYPDLGKWREDQAAVLKFRGPKW